MHTQELEKIFKALANKRRLRIIKILLRNPELTVSDIAERITLSLKATSRHLLHLLHIELVGREQRDKYVFYHIRRPANSLLKSLISHIHHSNE